MNSKLKSLLDSYEDFELAFLSRYKLSCYMPGTQESIRKYVRDRGLTDEKIERLMVENSAKTFADDYARCPRCKSKKIRTDKVEWGMTAAKAGYSDEAAALDGLIGKATYKDQIICEVCDLYLSDPNDEREYSKTIWKRLWDFLFDNPFRI